MSPRRILLLAAFSFLLASPSWAIEEGDIVVVKQDADQKVSGKIVGQVKAGEALKVHAVRGAWVQVGDKTKGWIRTDNVAAQGDSISEIDKLLNEKPGDPELLITRARMYLNGQKGNRRHSLELAEQDLQLAIRRDPSNAEARYYLAQIDVLRNQVHSAIGKLTEAINLKDDDGRFFAMRGRLYQQTSDLPAATRDFERAAELGEADPLMLNNLAWWLATNPDAAAHDAKKAVKYATQACDLTKHKNFMYVDTLAAAYAESNDFPNAIRWQEEAVRLCDQPGEKVRCEQRLKQYQLNQPYREVPR